MKIKKPKAKKIISFFKKLPRALAEKAFLVFLLLFFFGLIIGSIIFYKYNVLTKKVATQATKEQIKFNSQDYQEVLNIWQNQESLFNQADAKEYPNPFE